MTQLLRALENDGVKINFHLTGRALLSVENLRNSADVPTGSRQRGAPFMIHEDYAGFLVDECEATLCEGAVSSA